MAQTKSRFCQFTDEQWEWIEPLLPSNDGRQGHPFRENRKIVEGIVYRYRAGIPWRDLPQEEFGPWKTAWKRHARYACDGTWDRALQEILADADAAGMIRRQLRSRSISAVIPEKCNTIAARPSPSRKSRR